MLTDREASVVALISPDEVVALLQRLVQADSTVTEEAACRVVEDALQAAGVVYRRDPFALRRDNIIATYGDAGLGRTVLFSCHTDTVIFDVRLLPGQVAAEVWTDLEAHVAAVCSRQPDITATMERLYSLDAFETPLTHPDVQILSGCIEEFTRRPPAAMGKTGMCDANILVNRLGIPSVAYGPGNPSGAATDEFCDIERLELCTRVYALAAMRLLGTSP